MTKQKIIWTILPYGMTDNNQCRVSVVVSPRLTPDSVNGTLKEFPEFMDWPKIVADGTYTAEIAGRAIKLSLISNPDLELWHKLFTDKTPVDGFEYMDISRIRLRSYPIRNILAFLKKHYANLAERSPLDIPKLLPWPEADENLQDMLEEAGTTWEEVEINKKRYTKFGPGFDRFFDDNEPREFNTDVEKYLYEADRFYRRPKSTAWRRRPDFQHIPEPPKPPDYYDFHSIVAFLSGYPELMRRLGLVLDFVLDEKPPEAEGFLRLQIRSRLHDTTTDVTPWTAFSYDQIRFLTRPSRTDEDHKDGLLNLVRADDNYINPGNSIFDVYQVDPDGSALKTVNFVLSAQKLLNLSVDKKAQGYSEVTYTTGDRQGVAALRSGGLGVSQYKRAELVGKDADRATQNNDNLYDEGDGSEIRLYAEDVHRGYRVDVKDGSGTWRSLCARVAKYQLVPTRTNDVDDGGEELVLTLDELNDEGYVSGASTTSGESDSDHYLHESLFRWTGWSLCTPRPGKVIKERIEGNIQYEDPSMEEDEADNGSGVSARFSTKPGSLPRLRFGQKYSFRARIVDLAGNSLALKDRSLDEFTGASSEVGYWRFEPIEAPVVVHRTRVSEGESLERMVIRSNHDASTGDYVQNVIQESYPSSTDFDYDKVNERHFVPPKSSQSQCETHGLFDPYFGNDWEKIKKAYTIAAREEATLNDGITDDPDSPVKLITPSALDGIATTTDIPQMMPSEDNPLGDRMAGGQYVIHGEEQITTPWLPDGAAEGVAIRAATGHNLPGVTMEKYLGGVEVYTSHSPALAVYNDKLYMAWRGKDLDEHIRFAYFEGNCWSMQKTAQAQREDEVCTSHSPALAVYNGKMYMAWKGMGDDEQIWFSFFDGNRWSLQQQVPDVWTSNSPALAEYNGKLYMAWKGMGDDERIWFSYFDGKRWSEQQVAPDVWTSHSPALAVYHGKLYMAWKGMGDDERIWFSYFDGKRWTAQQLATGNTSHGPALAVYNGNLYMTWKGIGTDERIKYSCFDEYSWAAQQQTTGNTSHVPALAVYFDELCMAWKGIATDTRIWFSSFTWAWAEAKSVSGSSCVITRIPLSEQFVIMVKHSGIWPDRNGFRLILAEVNPLLDSTHLHYSSEPYWDEVNRTLTFFVPKGGIVRLLYSTYASGKYIKSFGLPQWVQNEAIRKYTYKMAVSGTIWLITPFRELTLVHATQQPVWEPTFGNLILSRKLGSNDVTLVDGKGMRLHGPSTGKFEIEATWDEWVDDPTKDEPERVPFKGQLGEIKLAENYQSDINLKVAVDEQWKDLDDVTPEQKQRADVHVLGDTRFRLIKYQIRATTRFREYLPPSIYKDQDLVTWLGHVALGDPMILPEDIDKDPGAPILKGFDTGSSDQQSLVPASAPPTDPKVLYVVPTMRWGGKQHITDGYDVTRFGNGLRVWLDRPWFSSGDGELLGVVIYKNDGLFANIPEDFVQLVTQWGADPFWASDKSKPNAKVSDFPRCVKSEEVKLQEASDLSIDKVTIVGHRVHFDYEKKLWYCDIEINLPIYMPFVRLALVRYQPNALETAKISKVVLTDFAQVLPTRSVSVIKTVKTLEVTLFGTNADSGPMFRDKPNIPESGSSDMYCRNRVELVLQTRDPLIDSDLAWTDTTVLKDLITANNWDNSEIFYANVSPTIGPLQRLMLREFERFYSDDVAITSTEKKRVIEERLVFSYIITA